MSRTSRNQQQKHCFLPSTTHLHPFSHLQLLPFFPPSHLIPNVRIILNIYIYIYIYFSIANDLHMSHENIQLNFGSSLANPSRLCPSMAVMVQPAVRCGCPGFSSTRSTCIPQQVGVSSTPAPRSGSTRRYGFSGSDLPLPLPLPFLGLKTGVKGKTWRSCLGKMKLVIFHLNE